MVIYILSFEERLDFISKKMEMGKRINMLNYNGSPIQWLSCQCQHVLMGLAS